jgi:hypothetical protein
MDKYNFYKNIFDGISTIDDINFLKEKCPKEDMKIIDSVIYSKVLNAELSIIQMNNLIKTLSEMKYKEICMKYIDDFKKNLLYKITNQYNETNSQYVYKTFIENKNNILSCRQLQNDIITKIISSKINDYTYIDLPKIDRECPHCGKNNKAKFGTEYIICGIDTLGIVPIQNGEDNGACHNDWCFKCGKKLCKNWYKHELFVENNRTHNDICCKMHSLENNFKYPDDYCQCNRASFFLF